MRWKLEDWFIFAFVLWLVATCVVCSIVGAHYWKTNVLDYTLLWKWLLTTAPWAALAFCAAGIMAD